MRSFLIALASFAMTILLIVGQGATIGGVTG